MRSRCKCFPLTVDNQATRRGYVEAVPLTLDHVIVLGERHLHAILRSYFGYYQKSRTHLSLCKDAPEPRAVRPRSMGDVVEVPEVGLGKRILGEEHRLLPAVVRAVASGQVSVDGRRVQGSPPAGLADARLRSI